jgi:hypothetical protein
MAIERISTVLLCHAEEPLHTEGIARWLNATTALRGIIRIHDSRRTFWRRVKREWRRSGTIGMFDILAFRLYYRFERRAYDAAWEHATLDAMRRRWPAAPDSVPVLDTARPNGPECEAFLRAHRPDAVVALCKHILQPRIFEIPRAGTLIFHDGIAPEYRNAHGCFWAMANDDFDRVGLTVLRADRGIDTGPIFGYFRYGYDPVRESYAEISNRVLLDNLPAITDLLQQIAAGEAAAVPTNGKASGVWGQPRLTSYLRLKRRLRRRGA